MNLVKIYIKIPKIKFLDYLFNLQELLSDVIRVCLREMRIVIVKMKWKQKYDA